MQDMQIINHIPFSIDCTSNNHNTVEVVTKEDLIKEITNQNIHMNNMSMGLGIITFAATTVISSNPIIGVLAGIVIFKFFSDAAAIDTATQLKNPIETRRTPCTLSN